MLDSSKGGADSI